MTVSYNQGLNFVWASYKETNWHTTLDTALRIISAHNHDEVNGKGKQITTAGLANNSIDSTKIRLFNNTSLRWRNAANSADINAFTVDGSDRLTVQQEIFFDKPLKFSLTNTNSYAVAGALNTAYTIHLLNTAGPAAYTLAAGANNQIMFITHINTGTATVTPAPTIGVNTAQLVQNGSVMYIFVNGEWRAFAGGGCTLI